MRRHLTRDFLLQSFLLALCCILFLTSAAAAADLALPAGALDAAHIETLFSGRTVSAGVEGKTLSLVFYFAGDGSLVRVRDGFRDVGRWEIRSDGRLCTELEGEGRDCRMIVNEAGVHRQYAVRKDGNHDYELTYVTFRKGEHLAQLSTEPLLPAGTLHRREVEELFSGQTVESVTAGKGRVSHTYYGPDGSLEQRQDGTLRKGKWRVRGDARICLQMEDLEEKCRIIVRERGEVKKYIVKKNGQHQHSVTYRKFTPGRHLP